MKTLIIIPARAGSKGLPGKNYKKLGEKPLINYSIEFALNIKDNDDVICLSTNDPDIISIYSNFSNINLLIRPEELSTDLTSMNDVISHALYLFQNQGINFKTILLLQPTSPFREVKSYYEMCKLLNADEVEIVVSVVKSKLNPYYNLFEENESGFIEKSKPGIYANRQSCPDVFAYNGSMYLMKKEPFNKFGLHGMKKIKKFEMTDKFSIDIDTKLDWEIAKYFLEYYPNNK
jgi:CMP-N,N'-diacetyllegionaminic acid synthase